VLNFTYAEEALKQLTPRGRRGAWPSHYISASFAGPAALHFARSWTNSKSKWVQSTSAQPEGLFLEGHVFGTLTAHELRFSAGSSR